MSPSGALPGRGGAQALLLSFAVALLAACASTNAVYVDRRSRVPVHVVQRGETLTKIAWQYRVDSQELANWNGILDPDLLRIGQRLRLVPPRGYVAAAPAPVVREPSAPRPEAADTRSPPRSTTPPARERRSSPPSSRPVAATRSPAPATASAQRWAWPTDGKIVTPFGATEGIGSGVGIGGREGQPVRAAAAGRVVYAGGGLIGYGQLVIIKHDDTFLSAYGHNAELLVTQGQEVGRGATIALMGQGPERQARLHFEIRRNGVPVDPLLFVEAPR